MADKENAGEPLETSPFRGDLEAELAVRPARGLSRLTLALCAGVTLVAGVIVGIQAEKAMGGASGTSSGTSGTAADARAAMRQGGPAGYGGQNTGQDRTGAYSGQGGPSGQNGRPGGQGGGQGAMTVGTVQKVEGGKVYLQTTDGSTVTVTTTDETTVRISKEGKVADLRAGGTVVVQGAKGEDGSVTATSISEGTGRGR
jgi:hypothetical protein